MKANYFRLSELVCINFVYLKLIYWLHCQKKHKFFFVFILVIYIFFLFRKEAAHITKTSRLFSLNAAFYLATIPLVTMAMFVPYVLTGNILTSDKVFTVIAIIATLNVVTALFVPKAITCLKECGVSLRRVEVSHHSLF